jgi:hypothetical protein
VKDRENALDRITALLRRQDQRLRLKAAAQIAFGIPLTLIGPALLATAFRFAARSIGNLDVPWFWAFGALLIILVPLLFRLELRTAGRFLDGALRESPPTGSLFSSMPGTYVALGGLALAPVLANPRSFSASVTEVFLCGPRLVITAFRQRRVRRRLGSVDFRRAARLVAELGSRSEGLELSVLPKAGEQLNGLLPVLNWLVFLGWIGVGQQVPRVYLYSEARDTLTGKRGG